MEQPDLLDVVGIGVGPANLGLAVALDEQRRAGHPRQALFLDRRPAFDWHPDMLLDSSVMQISFLKDLATQRNPSSPFTFLNYLHDRGRLGRFVNRQTFFPSRREFTDYLQWVVDHVGGDIEWSTHVESVDLSADGNHCVVRASRDGRPFEVRARHVVLGVGGEAVMPVWAQAGHPRVLHNTSLLSGLRAAGLHETGRVAVVGQGQSAAEVVRHVHESWPGHEVHCFMGGYGMVPADDSPFANRVFDADAVDDFYFAPDAVRDSLLARHRTTNYGCVDPDLLAWLHETEYDEILRGHRRMHFRRATRIGDAALSPEGVDLRITELLTSTSSSERFDAVVCATGFRSEMPRHLLGGFSAGRELGVSRDYRLEVDGRPAPIFVVGSTDTRHGLGAGLLSNIAIRSGEILQAMSTVQDDRVLRVEIPPVRRPSDPVTPLDPARRLEQMEDA
jgi:L-ornithine N5-monooxygenase